MATKKAVAKKTTPAKPAPQPVKAATPTPTTPAKPINTGPFAADSKIKVLVEANPKRQGSGGYKRFAQYKSGMTVAEALAKGVTRADLVWDVGHKFISIG